MQLIRRYISTERGHNELINFNVELKGHDGNLRVRTEGRSRIKF